MPTKKVKVKTTGGGKKKVKVQEPEAKKVQVSTRALIQRINRVLGKQDEQVKAYRGGRSEVQLGRYYIVDINRNFLVAGDVNLEALGRELKVLAGWEALLKDDDDAR